MFTFYKAKNKVKNISEYDQEIPQVLCFLDEIDSKVVLYSIIIVTILYSNALEFVTRRLIG